MPKITIYIGIIFPKICSLSNSLFLSFQFIQNVVSIKFCNGTTFHDSPKVFLAWGLGLSAGGAFSLPLSVIGYHWLMPGGRSSISQLGLCCLVWCLCDWALSYSRCSMLPLIHLKVPFSPCLHLSFIPFVWVV